MMCNHEFLNATYIEILGLSLANGSESKLGTPKGPCKLGMLKNLWASGCLRIQNDPISHLFDGFRKMQ